MKLTVFALIVIAAVNVNLFAEQKCEKGNFIEKLKTELSLSAEQVESIQPILDKKSTDIKAVKENPSLEPEAKKNQSKEIKNAANANIRAVLNAEQQTKFDEILKSKAEKKSYKEKK